MSQSTDNKPEVPATPEIAPTDRELREDELESVSGGIGIGELQPAAQKVRAAAQPLANDLQSEGISFSYDKIK